MGRHKQNGSSWCETPRRHTPLHGKTPCLPPLLVGLHAGPWVAVLATQGTYGKASTSLCSKSMKAGSLLAGYTLQDMNSGFGRNQGHEPRRLGAWIQQPPRCYPSPTSTTRLNTLMYREYTRSSCEPPPDTRACAKRHLTGPLAHVLMEHRHCAFTTARHAIDLVALGTRIQKVAGTEEEAPAAVLSYSEDLELRHRVSRAIGWWLGRWGTRAFRWGGEARSRVASRVQGMSSSADFCAHNSGGDCKAGGDMVVVGEWSRFYVERLLLQGAVSRTERQAPCHTHSFSSANKLQGRIRGPAPSARCVVQRAGSRYIPAPGCFFGMRRRLQLIRGQQQLGLDARCPSRVFGALEMSRGKLQTQIQLPPQKPGWEP